MSTAEEARRVIASGMAHKVELDYECAPADLIELGRYATIHGVAIQMRTCDTVQVLTPSGLRLGLSCPKNTHRQRRLCCMFSLAKLSHEELAWAMERVRVFGDVLLEGEIGTGGLVASLVVSLPSIGQTVH